MTFRHTPAPKGQLTMDAFIKRRTSNVTRPSVHSSSTPDPRISSQRLKIPKQTAPPFFQKKSSIPSCQRMVESESIADDAWNVGQTVFQNAVVSGANSDVRPSPYTDDAIIQLSEEKQDSTQGKVNLLSLPSSPKHSPRTPVSQFAERVINCDTDDDAFEVNSSPTMRTPRRSPQTLLDDRPSMTRRSTKRRKPRAGVICNGNTSTGAHLITSGDHSELSSETDSDGSEGPAADRPTQSKDSVIEPHPDSWMGMKYEKKPVEISNRSSPVQRRRGSTNARSKEESKGTEGKKVHRRPNQISIRSKSAGSSIRKRGRKLLNLFDGSNDSAAEANVEVTVGTPQNSPNYSEKRPGSSKRIVPDPPLVRVSRTKLPKVLSSDSESSLSLPEASTEKNSKFESELSGDQVVSRTGRRVRSASTFRKRKRIVSSSSSSSVDEIPCLHSPTPKQQVLPDIKGSDATGDPGCDEMFQTPLPSRRNPPVSPLPTEVHDKEAPTSQPVNSELEVKGIETRPSARTRKTSRVLDVTPSPPTPPSSRRKGRLSRLETKDISDTDDLDAYLLDNHTPSRRGRRLRPNHDSRLSDDRSACFSDEKKDSEWYCEREIDQFSISSPEGQDFEDVSTEGNIKNVVANVNLKETIAKDSGSFKCRLVDQFSDDAFEKDMAVLSQDMPTQSPKEGVSNLNATADAIVDRRASSEDDKRISPIEIGSIEDDEVLDLLDEEGLKTQSENCKIRTVVETPGEKDSLPPFYLNALCENGETVEQMIERLGEGHVLERISCAQQAGRKVVGGEQLGINNTFDKDIFSRFSETVVAGQVERGRTLNSITEQALRGEYKFNYRGRNNEFNRESNPSWRGRGRGGGRGGKSNWRRKPATFQSRGRGGAVARK